LEDRVTDYQKPVPLPDELSAPYWEAAREHQLRIQRCEHCGHFNQPPELICPNCSALEPKFRFEPVSGRGKILSWVVVHSDIVPGFADDPPWVNVLVELDEQPGLLLHTRLIDGVGAPVAIGDRVEVVFEDVTPDVTLPQFKLAPR
jgi:uncharacterized OB-fold protein